MSAFNPQAWLEAFEAVGGWYIVDCDQRLCVGWALEGFSFPEHLEAIRLFKEVQTDQDKGLLLKAHLLARQRIPA